MIDLLLRGGAIALLVLWPALAWTGPRPQRLFALGSLCGAIFLAISSAPLASALGAARVPLQVVAATGPFWFLIATRRAFGAPRVLTPVQLAVPGAVLAALALAAAAAPVPVRAALYATLDLVILCLFGAALFTAARGMADDLDPRRRTYRVILLTVSAAFGVMVTISAIAASQSLLPDGFRAAVPTLIAAGAFGSALALCLITFRMREPEAIRARPEQSARSPLAARILTALEQDRLYRDPNLTVSRLAEALSTPEHQVRAAINAELGFKNFSEFVNGYRLADVKAALADESQAEVPISTIALDAGFGSIASFNRVFKTAFGVAPSAFRRDSAG